MVAKNTPLAATISTKTEVFYPETDGMPLPDGEYQLAHFLEIQLLLRFFFKDHPDVAVSGNTFMYYVEGNPRLSVSPDCYVAFGVDVNLLLENNNYRVWDMGKVPDFVLEVGSPSTAANDMGDKRELYARLGIGEYWRFDPSGGDHYGDALVGERLVEGEYQELEISVESDGRVWGRSPTLGLELHWDGGHLRLYDPVGERWLRNIEETDADRESAEAFAEVERLARESAEARAETERAARREADTARESAEARAETERAARREADTARESAEVRLAELKAELRRLRGE